MTCSICGKPIDTKARNVYKLVKAWEKNRTPGEGVHPVRDREYLGEWAHGLCLDIKARGGLQESLL